MKDILKKTIKHALDKLNISSDIDINIDIPKDKSHGDYASNIAIANYVDLMIINSKSINCFKGLCTIIGSGGNL